MNDKEAQAVFLESRTNRGYTSYLTYPPCYPEINHATPTPYIYQLSGPTYPSTQTVNPTFMPQTHLTQRFGIENSDPGPKLKKEKQ